MSENNFQEINMLNVLLSVLKKWRLLIVSAAFGAAFAFSIQSLQPQSFHIEFKATLNDVIVDDAHIEWNARVDAGTAFLNRKERRGEQSPVILDADRLVGASLPLACFTAAKMPKILPDLYAIEFAELAETNAREVLASSDGKLITNFSVILNEPTKSSLRVRYTTTNHAQSFNIVKRIFVLAATEQRERLVQNFKLRMDQKRRLNDIELTLLRARSALIEAHHDVCTNASTCASSKMPEKGGASISYIAAIEELVEKTCKDLETLPTNLPSYQAAFEPMIMNLDKATVRPAAGAVQMTVVGGFLGLLLGLMLAIIRLTKRT